MYTTELLHLVSADLVAEATVMEVDADADVLWVTLSCTAAHPAGGGQWGDAGTIAGEPFLDVRRDRSTGQVKHILATEPNFRVGDKVEVIVDADRRQLASAVHTGGHALAAAVHAVAPWLVPVAGLHYPRQGNLGCRVDGEIPDDLLGKLNAKLAEMVAAALPILVQTVEGVRTVCIGELPGGSQPCGGTHLSSMAMLSGLRVLKVKRERPGIRIAYGIGEAAGDR